MMALAANDECQLKLLAAEFPVCFLDLLDLVFDAVLKLAFADTISEEDHVGRPFRVIRIFFRLFLRFVG